MTTQQKADISVVIPFFNRRPQVTACLTAVVNQELPWSWNIEIIAVDNGSTDGTLDALAAFPVKIVKCDKRGPAAARNAGIAAASGDIVVFTDSDCVPDRHWLALLMEPFNDPEMLATGGRIVALETNGDVSRFTESSRILNQMRFFKGVLCFPPFFATANAAYRASALRRVGGFDEDLYMSEDADLTWRVMEMGGKIAYCPDALVHHTHRDTIPSLFRQGIDYGTAAVAVFVKHRSKFQIKRQISWNDLRQIGVFPFELAARLLFARTSYKKFVVGYQALYLTGFLIGKIKGSFRHRVLFI